MAPMIKNLGDLKAVAPRFGPEAVKWVELKIEEAEDGEAAEVLAPDTQIMFILLELAERSQAMDGKPV